MSGVTSTGYVIKTLPEILASLQAKSETVFGPGVIQTSQSPLGQLLGLLADFGAEMEERNLAIYQSYDPTQSEGANLDKIGGIRALPRAGGQKDAAYARAITNQGQKKIGMSDRIQAIMDVDGVSWVAVKENSTSYTDASGIPPHSLAFAVIGGADADVAAAIYENTVPGIGLFGLSTAEVSVRGYCRQVNFIRPEDVPLFVDLTVRVIPDACACGLTSPQEVVNYLDAAANGDCGLLNGDLVDEGKIEALLGSIGGVSVQRALIGVDANVLSEGGFQASIFERPVIVGKNVNVRFV